MTWRQWTYLEWNERLVGYYFSSAADELLQVPVQRIPAAPEDLWEIALRPIEGADAVVDVFVRLVRERELPRGKKSFCSYCLDYGQWNPESDSLPHFFGMLWMTCLVAYGYPEGKTVFGDRVEQLLGRADPFQYGQPKHGCLSKLWQDLAEWTIRRNADGRRIRALGLPPEDKHRRIIGYSHYLAFPNRIDRGLVARALEDASLIGFEPPVFPVVRALEKCRERFSSDFRTELEDFVDAVKEGLDPRGSAFWRAVRQEALDPYSPQRAADAESLRTELFVTILDDGLTPFVACKDASRLPDGIVAKSLEDVADWPLYLVGESDEELGWRLPFSSGALLPLGTKKLLEQGVLILREVSSWLLEVAKGAKVSGCRTALVRRDRVIPFVRRFGGSSAPAIVDDWFEVHDCRVEQVRELPPDLADVTQLLPTMDPPSIALVGGLRTSEGFFFVPDFLPLVRAPGARSVSIRMPTGQLVPCVPSGGVQGDWALPSSLLGPGSFVVQASWVSLLATALVESTDATTATQLRFVAHHVEDEYKRKPAGDLFLESCPTGEEPIRGDVEVPLGITTSEPSESGDLLDYDSTARYLGPGQGQMSLSPQSGFDWLVVGAKNAPEVLVFVGNSEGPTKPCRLRSPDAGDRRLWRAGWNARKTYVRDGQRYVAVEEAPEAIRAALAAYRTHRVDADAPHCAATRLETMSRTAPLGVAVSSATQTAVDILAVMSSRRKGLRYVEVRDVLALLVRDAAPQVLPQVLRGWTEGGLVDVLREPRTSHLTFVARRPRFVLVRRGFVVDATIVGLLTSVRRRRLLEQAQLLGLHPTELLSGHPWQPSALRFRAPAEKIEELRTRVELPSSEWLAWRSEIDLPAGLDARGVITHLHHGAPTGAYRTDSLWSWEKRAFERGRSVEGVGIELERRCHQDGSNIFVVLVDGDPHVWCYLRSWAVLFGHVLRGDPPFSIEEGGSIVSRGRSPVHLPLPLARLCVLVGESMPGFVLETRSSDQLKYVYPFGRRLFGFVERLLPGEWFATRTGAN